MVSRGGEHGNNKGDDELGQNIIWVGFEKANIKRIIDSMGNELV